MRRGFSAPGPKDPNRLVEVGDLIEIDSCSVVCERDRRRKCKGVEYIDRLLQISYCVYKTPDSTGHLIVFLLVSPNGLFYYIVFLLKDRI